MINEIAPASQPSKSRRVRDSARAKAGPPRIQPGLWYSRRGCFQGLLTMGLVEQIEKDLPVAMKAQDGLRLSVLRMMKAALKNKQVELGKQPDDSQAVAVLRTLVKQRHESVEQFRKGGREDLAEKEEAEIKIVETYLPAAATEEEIDAAIAAALAETGASGAKDLGKAMKAVMAKFAGQNVDGKRVNEKVRAKLGG